MKYEDAETTKRFGRTTSRFEGTTKPFGKTTKCLGETTKRSEATKGLFGRATKARLLFKALQIRNLRIWPDNQCIAPHTLKRGVHGSGRDECVSKRYLISSINPSGGWTLGRDAVLKELKEVHSTFLKGVTDTVEEMVVKLAGPDVAVATVKSRMSPFTMPDGVRHENEQHIRTFVLVRRDGRWLIMQDQNTAVARPEA